MAKVNVNLVTSLNEFVSESQKHQLLQHVHMMFYVFIKKYSDNIGQIFGFANFLQQCPGCSILRLRAKNVKVTRLQVTRLSGSTNKWLLPVNVNHSC